MRCSTVPAAWCRGLVATVRHPPNGDVPAARPAVRRAPPVIHAILRPHIRATVKRLDPQPGGFHMRA